MNNFRIEKPFKTRPPRLKDLVNEHVMGDVWIRDTPFGPVTDSLKISKHFDIKHHNVLRAVDKCNEELGIELKFELNKNFIENKYLGGAKGKERKARKVDITEFGLMLLLLYINTPKARMISAEILYRFFILKSYIAGLNENQIGALKGYYRKRMADQINSYSKELKPSFNQESFFIPEISAKIISKREVCTMPSLLKSNFQLNTKRLIIRSYKKGDYKEQKRAYSSIDKKNRWDFNPISLNNEKKSSLIFRI